MRHTVSTGAIVQPGSDVCLVNKMFKIQRFTAEMDFCQFKAICNVLQITAKFFVKTYGAGKLESWRTSGSSFSILAPAKKSAQIISKQ